MGPGYPQVMQVGQVAAALGSVAAGLQGSVAAGLQGSVAGLLGSEVALGPGRQWRVAEGPAHHRRSGTSCETR